MRSSLLNLTWLTQEKRLQQGRLGAEGGAELKLLREFYRDARGRMKPTADSGTFDDAIAPLATVWR